MTDVGFCEFGVSARKRLSTFQIAKAHFNTAHSKKHKGFSTAQDVPWSQCYSDKMTVLNQLLLLLLAAVPSWEEKETEALNSKLDVKYNLRGWPLNVLTHTNI